MIPEKNLILVRLGHSTDEPLLGNPFVKDLEVYLDSALEMTQNVSTY